jgi:hypothetical protein
MKSKKFDCVEMKRKSQELIYNEIRNMTKEEELAFWQKGTIDLRSRQNSLKKNVKVSKK